MTALCHIPEDCNLNTMITVRGLDVILYSCYILTVALHSELYQSCTYYWECLTDGAVSQLLICRDKGYYRIECWVSPIY
jgi:hypothetical protein